MPVALPIVTPIVTLDEVKHHLRYDDDSNDINLTIYMKAAEASIRRFINQPIIAGAEGDVKVAALMLIGYLDVSRNAEPPPAGGSVGRYSITNGNYLPSPVVALLYDYRTPTIV